MDIPIHEMFDWHKRALGATLIGLAYILMPLLLSQSMNASSDFTRLLVFGFTFLGIGLIEARSKPAVLSGVFIMLLGLSYFMGFMTGYAATALFWTLSLVFIGLTFVFELHLIKFGPSNSGAKNLIAVPLAIIGFSLLLAIIGFNPAIAFNWSNYVIAGWFLLVMAWCWIYVLNIAGWKLFHSNNVKYLNIIAILAVLLSIIAVLQGLTLARV